jgi:hypothetical protein
LLIQGGVDYIEPKDTSDVVAEHPLGGVVEFLESSDSIVATGTLPEATRPRLRVVAIDPENRTIAVPLDRRVIPVAAQRRTIFIAKDVREAA